MFICCLKADTIKRVAIVGLSCVGLAILLTVIPTKEPTAASVLYADAAAYSYDNVKTSEDRIRFIEQFGWQVDKTPLEEKEVTIPADFDKVFISYNELQKQQGLDLGKYKRRNVMRYTYEVTNYPDEKGKVYLNLLVYRGLVIGGDICSADVNGFVRTFDGKCKLP